MESSPRRLRENEELMERINERLDEQTEQIREEDGDAPDAPIAFFCECSDLACRERIAMTPAEFRDVHRDPERFVLVPGHEVPRVEEVVERRDDHLVVRKLI
jgi:hypothetical protein